MRISTLNRVQQAAEAQQESDAILDGVRYVMDSLGFPGNGGGMAG
jgi:hypothetical protein